MTKTELLRKLSSLDFFLIDLHLYLDTHPNDAEAIEMYNSALEDLKKLREEYCRRFGALMWNSAASSVPWQWIDDPWPWDKAANFELEGGK